MKKPKSKMYKWIGGPYDGLKLLLVDSGTIEFKVGNFKGYYNNLMYHNDQMKWVNTNG